MTTETINNAINGARVMFDALPTANAEERRLMADGIAKFLASLTVEEKAKLRGAFGEVVARAIGL